MSVWRRKAIECAPELRKELEQPGTSIYEVFSELLPVLVKAHQENNIQRLELIYAFAEWCLQQKEKDLWNATGVAFYEHLGDHAATLAAIPQWVKPSVYKEIRGLLEWRMPEDMFKHVDKHFKL